MGDGFMTLGEFREMYGAELARKELVVLAAETPGRDAMWKREADGWYRLEGGDTP